MPFLGSIIPANIARIGNKPPGVERKRSAKEKDDKSTEFARALDEAELSSVEQAEALEKAEAVPEPQSEMSREDREKHGHYDTGGPVPPAKPNIDLSG